MIRRWRLPAAILEQAEEEIRAEGEAAIRRWLDPAELAAPRAVPAVSSATGAKAGRASGRRSTVSSARAADAAHIQYAVAREAAEAEAADAEAHGRVGYMSRAFVIAALPHSRPTGLEFKRSSGDYNLLVHIPAELANSLDLHLPYGPMPRLVFLWLTTQARRTRERVLHLGPTRSSFMRELMLTPRTGKRGNLKTFERQFRSLLAATFSAWRSDSPGAARGGLQLHHRHIASEACMWWDAPGDELEAILRLDAEFYEEMLRGGIPVQLDAIERIKDNSLALDIYIWLTYRFATLRQPIVIPWEYLSNQFGRSLTGAAGRSFRQFFKKQLALVLEVYPEASVDAQRAGLRLLPSPPHVRPRRH